jgi:uncharacterized membrane protein YhaH (DUF805 family)
VHHWTTIKWIAVIAGLTLLTIVLAFFSLNSFFAAGTFPGDPKEQWVGDLWACFFLLATVASTIGVGLTIRRFRHQLKTGPSSQGFPVIMNEQTPSRSSDWRKNE